MSFLFCDTALVAAFPFPVEDGVFGWERMVEAVDEYDVAGEILLYKDVKGYRFGLDVR